MFEPRVINFSEIVGERVSVGLYNKSIDGEVEKTSEVTTEPFAARMNRHVPGGYERQEVELLSEGHTEPFRFSCLAGARQTVDSFFVAETDSNEIITTVDFKEVDLTHFNMLPQTQDVILDLSLVVKLDVEVSTMDQDANWLI